MASLSVEAVSFLRSLYMYTLQGHIGLIIDSSCLENLDGRQSDASKCSCTKSMHNARASENIFSRPILAYSLTSTIQYIYIFIRRCACMCNCVCIYVRVRACVCLCMHVVVCMHGCIVALLHDT